MKKIIDLRSDTVTHPTEEMRNAMKNAIVGDDGYRDDQTLLKLEDMAAEIIGKEAAMFVVSGVMGNQLAVFTHCNRGDEVIMPEDCHIMQHENGATAYISSANIYPLEAPNGIYKLEKLEKVIRQKGVFPQTKLVCLENPFGSGVVSSLSYMEKVSKIAHDSGAKVHLDGARIFNGAIYLGVDVKEISKHADSVMFCLSKGLSAPVGSILAGDKEFIDRARVKRRIMGGDLRQAGVLAASGIIALEKMTKRLAEDHENAKYFANELAKIEGVIINPNDVHINMVYADFSNLNLNSNDFTSHLLEKGININPPYGEYRFVFHNDVSFEDTVYSANCIKDYFNK